MRSIFRVMLKWSALPHRRVGAQPGSGCDWREWSADGPMQKRPTGQFTSGIGPDQGKSEKSAAGSAGRRLGRVYADFQSTLRRSTECS